MSKNAPFWFVKDGDKQIQCAKEDFDRAIKEGKSVMYRSYANKKVEKIAQQLESSRMALLAKPDLPTKFRKVLTNPRNVIEVQVILVDDPLFWEKESKLAKYY
jgi:hypothetical protein